MNEKIRIKNQSPLISANFFSRLFFNWISPLLKKGYEKPLTENDLYSPIPQEECKFLTDQLEKEWLNEQKKIKPSIISCFFRIYWLRVFFLTFFLIVQETNRIIFPILVRVIIKYFNGQSSYDDAVICAIFIAFGVSINCFLHHWYFLEMNRIGIKMKLASCGLIYKKALSLNFYGIDNKLSAQVMNMLSNDATKIEFSVIFMPYLLVVPLEFVAMVIILTKMIDLSVLAGLILVVIFIPVQLILGKALDKLRRKAAQKCDKRIEFLNEIFNGIKIIKMYCWETPFGNAAQVLRKHEMKFQKLIYFVSAINSILELMLPTLITFISVTCFVLFADRPLTPSLIVISMSFYLRISSAVGFYFFKAIIMSISGRVSLKRIEKFLMEKNLKKSNNFIESENSMVKVTNMFARWSSNENSFYLKNFEMEAKNGDLIAIIGPVGSGKSSFLLSLIEELEKVSGDIDIKGSVFYVPQEPWIFTASLKQNILFGKTYNKKKFDEIIKVCCLEEDLKSLSNGEHTLIGEKGINLSGGQRARVSVARALYSDAQIYLFDDPLSAVDFNVAKKLYENCFNKYLKSKIRILVTHQVHHLSSNVSEILYLVDGQIKFRGNFSDLISFGVNMEMIEEQENEDTKPCRSRNQSITDNFETLSIFEEDGVNSLFLRSSHFSDLNMSVYSHKQTSDSEKNQEFSQVQQIETNEENRIVGDFSWKIYFKYFQKGGGLVAPFILFIIYFLSQTLIVSADYWVSYWAGREEKDMRFKDKKLNLINSSKSSLGSFNHFSDRSEYFLIYCFLSGLAITFGFLRIALFYTLAGRSAINLYQTMFGKVLRTPIRFFDINPIGRIINRFSNDTGILDDIIPSTICDFMNVFMTVLGSISLTLFLNYWILFPTIALAVLFVFIRNYYLTSSMEIKRIEGTVRSPIFVHMGNTLCGMSTIRAANMEEKLNEEFFNHVDFHTRATSASIYINRWLGIRLDAVTLIFTYTTLISCLLIKRYHLFEVESSEIGLMLVYLLQSTNLFQWAIRQSCEVENLMTSVERVLEYSELETEPLDKGDRKPPVEWPSSGEICFNNVSFKYDKNLSNVLNNINIKINAGEKIGIVGRTGAGKSSIIQTLFRMAEPDGSLYIDDIDIKELSLHDLRSKLSIIPQEPTLFIGTIRTNLDPLNQYADNVLWDALEQVQLKEAIKELKDGLESEVHKGGSNLSVGQKQLICLARAIIKKSKILIIDEATANVDFKTDSMVQEAIRQCFKECTVITIAHRLHTIIDNDRILCLSQGRVVNFGRPYELIEDETTILHDLVFSLDKLERDKLVEMAKKSFRNQRRVSMLLDQVVINQSNQEMENLDHDYSEKIRLLDSN